MANIARSVFLGALLALVFAVAVGRIAGIVIFAGLALAALFAFTRISRDPLIPFERMGVTLTKAGWGTAFFVIFVVVSAIQSGANLLFFLASAMIGGIAAALAYAPLALGRTSLKISLPAWAFVGEEAMGELSVVNAKRFLPIVALTVKGDADGKVELAAAAPVLTAGSSARVDFPIKPSARGVARSARLLVSTAGPIGLARRVKTVVLSAAVTVYPKPAEVELPASVRQPHDRGRAATAREGDFAGLRDWRPGDSPKHIHWRSSARAGRLVAKEFAVIEQPEVTVFLDTMGAEGEAFESAVSRAAGYAVAAAQGLYKVKLCYFDTALRTVEDDVVGGLPHRVLRALAEMRPQTAASLDDVLLMAGAEGAARGSRVEVRIGAATAKEAAGVS
jgi:uncharacterized protein (DUF58 family)